jgi:predicted RecB family nuclease
MKEEKEMKMVNEICEKLTVIQSNPSTFSKIMHAQSVQELLDLHLNPEEIVPLYRAVDKLAAMEEELFGYPDIIAKQLKSLRPVNRRRPFFI